MARADRRGDVQLGDPVGGERGDLGGGFDHEILMFPATISHYNQYLDIDTSGICLR